MVIDGKGGGMGGALVSRLKAVVEGAEILAVGTNALATSAMLKAGADDGATGENSIVTLAAKADVIAGPIGIVLADSMLGEITAAMAAAVSRSSAYKVLIPNAKSHVVICGNQELPLGRYLEDAVEKIIQALQ
ncbi:DUF3842 family protein [Acidaminobacterium chupaoyuni]